MDTNERAALYVRFLEEAAAEYKCAVTDMPAKMAATRRLSFEVYQARLIEGRDPDVSVLKWFLEQEALHAPPPEPLRVTVEIVEPTLTLPPPDPPSSGVPPPAPANATPAASAPSALPANVVPIRKAGGSIHDAVLPDGTPARMTRSNYDHLDAASNPFPDVGRGHPLPPIPPECFPK